MKPLVSPVLSDSEIVTRIVDFKENELFSLLYKKYSPKVQYKCYSILKQKELAEEFVHEIFVRVFEKLYSFNHASSFSTWLYSVASNYCFEYLRSVKRHMLLYTMLDMYDDIAEQIEFDEEPIEDKEKRLLDGLSKLNESDKKILELKYSKGYSIDR